MAGKAKTESTMKATKGTAPAAHATTEHIPAAREKNVAVAKIKVEAPPRMGVTRSRAAYATPPVAPVKPKPAPKAAAAPKAEAKPAAAAPKKAPAKAAKADAKPAAAPKPAAKKAAPKPAAKNAAPKPAPAKAAKPTAKAAKKK